MEGYFIRGKISKDALVETLRKAFPDQSVRVSQQEPENSNQQDIIVYSDNGDQSFQAILKTLDEKEIELKVAEESVLEANKAIKVLHLQQREMFQQFELLRNRYDELKDKMVEVLWLHCAKYNPGLRQIPPMEDKSFIETEAQVGDYILGEFLGEGQFASVNTCWVAKEPKKKYALKMINKDKILNFVALTRVSNEIENLQKLRSRYIVSVLHVMHTAEMLYLVTELGGCDMFEFFKEHPDGVNEAWAREIMASVLKGVLVCHENGICHRDLKPENILVTFDTKAGRCVDLKLCDFGLSTKFEAKSPLKDFVGSPGFFAPEMLINGCYIGDKCDVWSVGCIMLELIMGHDKFCDVWMTAYDYDACQDKEQFTDLIHEAVENLPDVLNFTPELNDFVLRFLELRSSRRPTIKSLCAHAWLQGTLDEELVQFSQKANGFAPPSFSPANSMNKGLEFSEMSVSSKHIGVSSEVIKAAYMSNISDRERKQIEEYNQHQHQDNNDDNGHHTMHLPPIMPQTPSVSQAKKILRRGEAIASADYSPHHLALDMSTPAMMSPLPMASFTPDMSPSPSKHNSFISPMNPNRSPLPSVLEMEEKDEGTLTRPTATSADGLEQQRPLSSSSASSGVMLKSKSELLNK